jgi:hypothetical protein
MFHNLKTLTLTAASLLAAATAGAQDAKVDFATQIYPFIKSSCVDCHRPSFKDERGRTKKPKAGLIVTSKEDFLKGAEGDKEGEREPVIVAGNAEKSSFLQRTLLPSDSDDVMPPTDKAKPWTQEQKDLFKKWILQGADFGSWTADPAPNEGLPEKSK